MLNEPDMWMDVKLPRGLIIRILFGKKIRLNFYEPIFIRRPYRSKR